MCVCVCTPGAVLEPPHTHSYTKRKAEFVHTYIHTRITPIHTQNVKRNSYIDTYIHTRITPIHTQNKSYTTGAMGYVQLSLTHSTHTGTNTQYLHVQILVAVTEA